MKAVLMGLVGGVLATPVAPTCFDEPRRDHLSAATGDKRNWKEVDPLCANMQFSAVEADAKPVDPNMYITAKAFCSEKGFAMVASSSTTDNYADGTKSCLYGHESGGETSWHRDGMSQGRFGQICCSHAEAASCVGPAGLALAFGSYPPTGPASDLCPAFSSDCAALKYHEEGCDTCGKSNVGFTADTSMALGEGLTVSVMAKPASGSFFYGELVGQGGAFNLGWYPARGVSGCSPGYVPGMKIGEWNHIVLRYTQTSCTLYVNGARHDGRENLKSISSRVGGKIAPAIGCRGPASGQGGACEGDYHFSGDRGEIGATAIWDRALSDGEVRALTLEGANSLTTAICSKPTTTTTTTAAPAGALQAMEDRLAAVEASNAALTEKLARFEALEAKLQQLSLLKVEKTGSMCTVQCDNGRNSGILELD